MFQAVCSECDQNCEVPFQPSGGKPVLCRDCFGQKGNRRNNRSDDRHGRPGDRPMFQATCDKCGNKCEVPFRPTSGKPVFCNNCFEKKSGHGDRRGGRDRFSDRDRRGGGNDQVFQKLESLSSKIDRVLSLLDPGAVKKGYPKQGTDSKAAPKKPVAGKKTAKKAGKKK